MSTQLGCKAKAPSTGDILSCAFGDILSCAFGDILSCGWLWSLLSVAWGSGWK